MQVVYICIHGASRLERGMQLQTVRWAHVTFVNMPVKLILIIHSSMKSGALL